MPKVQVKNKSAKKLHHDPLEMQLSMKDNKIKRISKLKRSTESKELDDSAFAETDADLEHHTDQFFQKIDKKQSIAQQFGDVQKEDGTNEWDSEAEESDTEDEEIIIGEDEENDFNDGTEQDLAYEKGYIVNYAVNDEEEAVVQKFLDMGGAAKQSLADIIMNKIKERQQLNTAIENSDISQNSSKLPDKVFEVFNSVGKLLQHFKSGKLPKALKMLPHLKNWEQILWVTRPDCWSAAATYACTRIFASNLNEKMAQRFFNLVLLEKCRDDIRVNKKLNYYLYLALKKALFKPAAFYKGLLLPLAQSRTCTLREAAIVGSVLSKVSVPANHSAAVLLRLADMPYAGSNSSFIKILLNKKYSLPSRVIEALVKHFCDFEMESRLLPIIWHQSLLTFVQRYKYELNEEQKQRLQLLLKHQHHHQISQDIRRELTFNNKKPN